DMITGRGYQQDRYLNGIGQRHAAARPNRTGDITGKAADSMNLNNPLTNRG
ncbi:hypothetical protein FHU36_006463, partial [Nonomuraea muscovyensis]|nr:hypothetical protein [Nonomuraea muscovyensis]